MKIKADLDDDGIDDVQLDIPSVIVKGAWLKIVVMIVTIIGASIGMTAL